MKTNKLSQRQIKRITEYKKILEEVETTSLKETISNFEKDIYPENEVQIWEKMALLYKKKSENNPSLSLSDKKKIFKDIFTMSLKI